MKTIFLILVAAGALVAQEKQTVFATTTRPSLQIGKVTIKPDGEISITDGVTPSMAAADFVREVKRLWPVVNPVDGQIAERDFYIAFLEARLAAQPYEAKIGETLRTACAAKSIAPDDCNPTQDYRGVQARPKPAPPKPTVPAPIERK